jgi:hypothetical protein
VTEATKDAVCELLTQSLIAWRIAGTVQRTSGGGILLRAGGKEIYVEPAGKTLPFRWMVSADGRKRGAISLVSVLRQVRGVLDPGYAGNRVRVSISPLVPS